MLDAFEAEVQSGIDETFVKEVRRRLCDEFGAVVRHGRGFQESLWEAVLTDAHDCDAEVLSGWMREGFPLGINREITATGVFPQTDKDTAAVEASRVEGVIMSDEDMSHSNYVSFNEAGDKGQCILDEMVEQCCTTPGMMLSRTWGTKRD